MRVRSPLVGVFFTLCVCLSNHAWAQLVQVQGAELDLPLPVQFDFINPGARSLALGGTFIGLADDATSASTNPAGLAQLSRLEISFEGRYRKVYTTFLAGGRLGGSVTNIGVDTIDGPLFGKSSEGLGGLSFASIVYPHQHWTIAGYRQEGAKVRRRASLNGAFDFIDGDDARQFPGVAFVEASIVHYGGSVAVRAGKVSAGGGLSVSHLDYAADSQAFAFDTTFPAFYQAQTFTSLLGEQVQVGKDWGVGGTFGVMVYPTSKIQIGASYRRGAEFNFGGSVFVDIPELQPSSDSFTGKLKVPDIFGVGVALRPLDGVTIAFDADRVKYSQLDDFVRAQIVFEPEGRDLYAVPDATELHVGGEYVITRWRLLPAVRAGYWNEGDNSVTYAGIAVLSATTNPLAHDVRHYSLGGGVAFSPKAELNGAYEWSERAKFFSMSMIVRF